MRIAPAVALFLTVAASASAVVVDPDSRGSAPADATLGGVNVRVDWRNQYDGQTGTASATIENSRFAYFWFYSASNPEVFVKVLPDNSPDWIQLFAGGLTDLEYKVTFTCGARSQQFLKAAGAVNGFVSGAAFPRGSCGGAGSAPVADFTFTPSTPAPGTAVSFADSSTGGPTAWSWNFGDGGTSTLRNPTHSFGTAGDYTVTLTASNGHGSTSRSRTVAVRSTSSTFRVYITNNWVRDGIVSVGSTTLGLVPGGERRYADITGGPGTTVRITTSPLLYSDGSAVPGAGTLWWEWTFAFPESGATYERETDVHDSETGDYYWAPIFRNRTGGNIDPFVDLGLSNEFVFPGYFPPGTAWNYIGYYDFYSNSNFGYFRAGGAPNGSYYWWYSNLSGVWNSTDGTVDFDCLVYPEAEPVPPAAAPRGEMPRARPVAAPSASGISRQVGGDCPAPVTELPGGSR